jgi:hypothetical protein
MRITVAIGLGLALAANGLFMLFDPAGWYALAPGVPETGPLNLHFVRDIGCAYTLAGLALAGLAFNERAWPAALIGALFLTLHALIHVADGFSGRVHANHVLTDLVSVHAPAAIALWLVLLSTPSQGVCPC